MKYFLTLFTILFFVQFSYSRNWWGDAVFYEIFVRSFYDSDGDGVGDLRGVIEKLDYLNDGDPDTQTDLGINGIWLMPIFASPSYHGYDTDDYYTINPDYGTMEDFELLLDEAHKRGIKIILDLVLNHTSRNIEWFIKSSQRDERYNNYYIWRKDMPPSDSGWGTPWGGGSPSSVWHKDYNRDEYFYGAFYSGMPDLNYNEPLVWEDIKAVTKFWLDKGVDGFRLDAIRYIVETGPGNGQADTLQTLELCREFAGFVKGINPEAVLIGEVWTGNQIVNKYYLDGEGIDMSFDFEFADKILLGSKFGTLINIKNSFENKSLFDAPLNFYIPFLSNHDTIRAMTVMQNDFRAAKIAAVALLTMPGAPFIYYGEEIGMYQNTGANGHGDILKRTPMQWDYSPNAGFTTGIPWTPIVTTEIPYLVVYQEISQNSLLNTYRRLIRLRRDHPEFRSNEIEFFDTISEKVLFYSRTSESGESSYVIINGSNYEKTEKYDAFERKEFIDLMSGTVMSFADGIITLNPKQYYILKKVGP